MTRLVAVVLAILALVHPVAAQETFFWFYISGSGDLMESPPVFSGGMDPGGDTSDGSWSVTVCDHGWPTDPEARSAYIWETFFASNYTTGDLPYWTGHLDTDHGQPHRNQFAFTDHDGGGSLSGYCTIQYQVQDANANGELDEGEFCQGALTFLQVVVGEGSSGVWDGWGGTGSAFGQFDRACPTTDEVWHMGVYLWLEDGWGY